MTKIARNCQNFDKFCAIFCIFKFCRLFFYFSVFIKISPFFFVFPTMTKLTPPHISNTDYNSPEQVLDEAYYSINCDYYLSAYLQYPLYRTKPDSDFLRPYFDLWRQGYGFTLDEDCLYLCKYSGLTLNQYGVASPCRTICTVCGFVALS